MHKLLVAIFILACSGCGPSQTGESGKMQTKKPSIAELVEHLDLEQHIEGGYFRQTFKPQNGHVISTDGGDRVTMTSIYYLLTSDSPIGHFHKNTSDLVHYFHAGDPITYYLIYPDGRLETKVLGANVLAGDSFQLVVKGGVWKASAISPNGINGYGLIGEAVAPGFEYTDMQLGETDLLINQFPQHTNLIQKHTR